MRIDPENADDGKHWIILRLMRIFVMGILMRIFWWWFWWGFLWWFWWEFFWWWFWWEFFDPDQMTNLCTLLESLDWPDAERKPGLIIMIGIGMPDLVIFVNTRNYNDPGCNHTFLENSPQNNRQKLAIKVKKLHWKGCPCTRQGCKMSNIMVWYSGSNG